MNLAAHLACFYLPEFAKKRGLRELFCLTADAFGCAVPDLRGLPYGECLTTYALFTRQQAERYLPCEQTCGQTLDETKDRLFRNSYMFGQRLKRLMGIVSRKDSTTMLRVVYKAIGIDLQCDEKGQILIRHCFFSKHYTPEVCRVVSSLDQGLVAGLSGGGGLVFTERITEGSSCCKAHFGEESVR